MDRNNTYTHEKHYWAEVDSVRYLCNILVVVVHAYPFMYVASHGWEYWTWTFICADFSQSILPTLFLLSGFLFFKGFSMSQFLHKLKKRCKRLLLPLIAWNLVFVVLYLLLGLVSDRAYARVQEFGLTSLPGILSKSLPFVKNPIDAPMWFVQALLVCVLSAPIFWFSYKIARWYGLGIIILLSFVANASFHNPVRWLPSYSFACFMIGGGIAMSGNTLDSVFGMWRIVWICISVGAMLLRMGMRLLGVWDVVLNDLSFICMAPWLLAMAPCINRAFNNHFSQCYLLPTGFFVFASHLFFNSVFMHAIGSFCVSCHVGDGFGLMSITAVLTMICVFGCSIFMWHLLHRICPRVLAILDGK